MLFEDTYQTIEKYAEGTFRDRGSKFIGRAYPVNSEGEAKSILSDIRKKYHDANHHCYAYRIGFDKSIFRNNDDGEPSGTAGKPILGQINSFALTNILVVVVRYFGGTLLGTSGLINAYKTATEDALRNAEIIERTLHDYYLLTFPYVAMNDIMKILKDENAGQSDQRFLLECSLIADFRLSHRDRIIDRIARIEGLNYRYIETK